jgi:hypothetical protein
MPTPRADISTLEISSTPSNLKKALRLREKNPDLRLTDPEIVEQLLADSRREYELAMADVDKRGTVIEVARYTSKGKSYTTEELNPYYRVAARLSSHIASLTLMLAKLAPKKNSGAVIPGSAAAIFPELFQREQVS